MQTGTRLVSLSDPLLYEQFEKDLKFLQLFLLLLNESCPIKRVELVWADDRRAGRAGLRQKFLSTEQALVGPCAHMLASSSAPEPEFCNIVSDRGRHEAESCGISDKAAESRVRRTGKAEVYRCHAGLIDIAVPVISEGKYLATLFTGQVLSAPPTDSGFVQIEKDIARLTYIDRAKLQDAYGRVPVVSESEIQRTIEVLEVLAEYLATTWQRLSDIVRDQQRRYRESNLERKEFGHLVLEGSLRDRPLVRQLMSRIGFTRYPNCVMVVKFECEDGSQRVSPGVDLLLSRALQAVEEVCDNLQNATCTHLRNQGICIFFREREPLDAFSDSDIAESLARRVLRAISASCELKVRIGIGAPKDNWWYLADSYHEACASLAGSSAQVAIYHAETVPDEELSLSVLQICRAISENRLVNARMLVLGLPLLVNKKMGTRCENLAGQHHFLSYVLDAMLFAARQVGVEAHGINQLQMSGAGGLELAACIFDLQESFLRSADCVLDSVRKLFAGRPRKLVDRIHSIIERALEDRQSAQTLSIVKIASALGISAGHLSRMFKRATGVTLERYLMIRRIDAAKRLLLEPLENVSEIAERCGFSDPAYFARVFRRIAGCSPREYRNDPMRFTTPLQREPYSEVTHRSTY